MHSRLGVDLDWNIRVGTRKKVINRGKKVINRGKKFGLVLDLNLAIFQTTCKLMGVLIL